MGQVANGAPEHFDVNHDISEFDCGNTDLNLWLRNHGLRAQRERTAMTYVATQNGKVMGYFSLAAHSVERDDIGGGKLARNAPPLVPVVLLARLAVDKRQQRRHLGSDLLLNAIHIARETGRLVGLRAVVVDPTDAAAANFYLRLGFRPFPAQPDRLFYPL